MPEFIKENWGGEESCYETITRSCQRRDYMISPADTPHLCFSAPRNRLSSMASDINKVSGNPSCVKTGDELCKFL
ncbi:hypothetical protein TNCV_1540261 [Trichonephila clavipes]|nr:hypothetical protein TNCV_1540261 [Trichonephila clavipes]